MTRKIAVFPATDVVQARNLLGRVLERHPEDLVVVYVRDDHRSQLAADLEYCVARSDKPVGGKLAFVRALRSEQFDLAYVAWHGGDEWQPMRLVALFAGARRTVAIDEFAAEFEVRWLAPWTWWRHALRRLTVFKAWTLVRAAGACYRATIGLVLAAGFFLGSSLLAGTRTVWSRRPRA